MCQIQFRKYRCLVLCSILSFYIGCKVTTTFLWGDCDGPFGPVSSKILRRDRNANDVGPKTGLESQPDYSDVRYAILILSGPNNKARRETIRNTWMRLTSNLHIKLGDIIYQWNKTLSVSAPAVQHVPPKYIKFFFVVGTKTLSKEQTFDLMSENERTKDMLLLEDLQDGYSVLTEKMARAIEWFNENMKNLDYLIKCDDDSFVRIDLIVRNLVDYAPEMSDPDISEYVSYKEIEKVPSLYLYWGYFNGKARVYYKGKWQERDWFLCDRYLPYALGGGYVITKFIVDYIAKNHQFFSRYNSEDVSMGVWTAALRGVHRVHDVRFDTEWVSRGCSNNMLVRHKQTPEHMFKMFKNLVQTKGQNLCMTDGEDRRNYMYKWDVLPSECCNRI